MNNSTKIIIIGSLLSTLGIAGLAKAISTNQPQLPIAIIPQHHSSIQVIISKDKDVKIDENREQPDAANDADTEVNDDKVPTSLSQVGEYGESIYDMAKANDWTKATANLTSLENAPKSLRTEIKGENKTELVQLDAKIVALKGAVTAKNRISAMRDANQVTTGATQGGFDALISVVSNTKTAVESGNFDKAQQEFDKFENAWVKVEDGVKTKSSKTYNAIENAATQVKGALKAKDKAKALEGLQTLNSNIATVSKG
ncbi:hypothetical protein CEN48_14740 [Fischerella thermalis CCMEE 5282]|uniref:DUF4363 family protein n=1 Tax=Fischerella thermalis TaxID=372787 RepID=UPI000C804E36|nr:hypothetical protein CEN48_14740 [Fischerella thermalis CCMEE 5282]